MIETKLSITKQCRDLAIGGVIYAEFDTIKQAQNAIKRLNLAERLPLEMKGFEFKCVTYTSIALVGGDIIYINKVTRTK